MIAGGDQGADQRGAGGRLIGLGDQRACGRGHRDRRLGGGKRPLGGTAQPSSARRVDAVPSGGQPQVEVGPCDAVGAVEQDLGQVQAARRAVTGAAVTAVEQAGDVDPAAGSEPDHHRIAADGGMAPQRAPQLAQRPAQRTERVSPARPLPGPPGRALSRPSRRRRAP
ncbi:MAG TPA: hypothetical protein VFL71_18970 [Actinomycetes bacterium]|nr:hypothetical protein [Actinomycetes bacterium]